MKLVAIVCHPEQKSMTWSVYGAFLDALSVVSPDVEIDLIDLHRDNFDPAQ